MIETAKHLFLGDQRDYGHTVRTSKDWAVVHACKEPYHREALGYRTRGAPKDHPEYLFAMRDNGRRLILNFVDTPEPAYVRSELFEVALPFIDEWRRLGTNVLVHCNQGRSRSPAIVLAYLASKGEIRGASLDEAEQALRRTYPAVVMSRGVRGFLEANWHRFVRSSSTFGTR